MPRYGQVTTENSHRSDSNRQPAVYKTATGCAKTAVPQYQPRFPVGHDVCMKSDLRIVSVTVAGLGQWQPTRPMVLAV